MRCGALRVYVFLFLWSFVVFLATLNVSVLPWPTAAPMRDERAIIIAPRDSHKGAAQQMRYLHTKNRIEVATAATHEDIDAALKMCQSVLASTHRAADVRFHFIVPPTEAADMVKCVQSVCGSTAAVVPLDFKYLAGMQVKNLVTVLGDDGFHPFDFAKLYLAEVLHTNMSRVIFIEANTIVQGDISELWATHLVASQLAACVPAAELNDPETRFVLSTLPSWLRRVNFFAPHVFVANLVAWRKHNISKLYERWVRRNVREGMFAGLTAGPMNAVVGPFYQPLPLAWGVRVSHAAMWNLSRLVAAASAVHWSNDEGVSMKTVRERRAVWHNVTGRYNRAPACAIGTKDSLHYPDSLRIIVSERWIDDWLSGFVAERAHDAPGDVDGLLPTPDGKIHVAMAFSIEHAKGAFALCRSVKAHTKRPDDVRFHFVTPPLDAPKVTRCSRKYCGSTTEVQPFDMSYIASKDMQTAQDRNWRPDLMHPMNLARFFLAEVFPNLPRTIYLDIDMACKTDIEELWNVRMKNGQWGAFVPDPNLESHLLYSWAYPRLNFTLFNAGMCLANLNAWRSHKVGPQCMKVLQLNSHTKIFKGVTQGPMIFAFGDRYELLDMNWNVRFWKKGDFNVTQILDEAKIIHWAGRVKPWSVNGTTVRGYELYKRFEVVDDWCLSRDPVTGA